MANEDKRFNIDTTPREIPYSGENRAEFQTRMGEYRRVRNILNKAASAARRRGDASSYINYLDTGAKRGIQVGGTDRVPRIRQKVLADMERDRENAIANAAAMRKVEAIQNRPDPEGPRVRRPEVKVIPPMSDEEKEVLDQANVEEYGDVAYGYAPYSNPYRGEDLENQLLS